MANLVIFALLLTSAAAAKTSEELSIDAKQCVKQAPPLWVGGEASAGVESIGSGPLRAVGSAEPRLTCVKASDVNLRLRRSPRPSARAPRTPRRPTTIASRATSSRTFSAAATCVIVSSRRGETKFSA